MKTFDQLTPLQKSAVIYQVTLDIKAAIEEGTIDFGSGNDLTSKTIDYYALAAAEGGVYSEDGEPVMGMDVYGSHAS